MKLTSFLFITAYLACTLSTAVAEAPFSTNDLSILFPLHTASALPKYQVNPGDQRLRILSRDNFEAVLSSADKLGVELTAEHRSIKRWYLTGLRYQPCVYSKGEAKPCQEQLRFVYQLLANIGNPRPEFQDYVIHVVYTLNTTKMAETSPVLSAFRELKNKYPGYTLDKPLSPNPILDSAKGSAYFKDFSNLVIAKHVNTRKPTLITFMGFGKGGTSSDHWIFFKGNVNASGDWKLAPLPVGAPETSEQVELDNGSFTLKNNLNLTNKKFFLFDSSQTNRTLLAFSILDQRLTNDHNVSCASCHMADRLAYMFMGESETENQLKVFTETLKGKLRPSELVIDSSMHEGRMSFEVSSFRMFGFRSTGPIISQRTVNDSALAVEQANQLLNLKPQTQCPSANQRQMLMRCLYSEGGSALNCLIKAHCID